jgi:FAD:protein FMN transferase
MDTVRLRERPEAQETFDCFGSTCSVFVSGDANGASAAEAAAATRERLLAWHDQFSRFDPQSELSRLNADPRETVPVSPMMARFADAVTAVGALTGGLVDGTLLAEIENAGYVGHLDGPALALGEALERVGERRPAGPSLAAGWRSIRIDPRAGTITRPPGVQLDSGGVAKGLFADTLADELAAHASFAVDCGGDVRWGGTDASPREVHVASPYDGEILHTFSLAAGAVATSGIGKRLWLDHAGRPAHHILDPSTGRPAFTGVVQATALASTGLVAEALAKAALLAGPEAGRGWLMRGGLLSFDDHDYRILEPQ